ncbi:MAG: T9SS type A sorting domain-containing protein [Bacteroidota bacterium]
MHHYLNLSFWRITCLFIGILVSGFYYSSGQIILNSDNNWPRSADVNSQPSLHVLRTGSPDTLSISASQPFFDDFSSGDLYPDSARWFTPLDLIKVPVITQHVAVDPPSRGTVSFDGNNRFGVPYNSGSVASGITDQLLSHYIDLEPYSPANQLYLSFFLQPQGNGDRPETRDSFFVYVRTPSPAPNDYTKVFSLQGSSLTDFQQHIIHLDDPEFFHTGFQLLFQATGSQNGSLDEWHLDYVYLGLNRSASDTLYQDQSIVGVVQSPLSPYTALPVQHYQELMNPMTNPIFSLSNLANNGQSVTLTAELSDPVAFTPMLPPFNHQGTLTLPGTGHSVEGLPIFGTQVFDELAALEMDVQLNGNNDQRPENNQLIVRYPIDSVLAYDDGERDGGFGLNQPLGFGTQINLTKPDSVSAVWISFQPTMHFNQVSGTVTFLKDHTFRLVIWNQPHPDSTLVVQLSGMKVDYGDQPHSFIRYALNSPVSVPQTFWVGVQQVDGIGLGVGFDRTYDNDGLTFYDSLGHWVNPHLGGTLMIRPEMVNTQPISAGVKEAIPSSIPSVSIWPNPLDGRELTVLLNESSLGTQYAFELLDVQGKQIHQMNYGRIASTQLSIQLPVSLQAGLYIIRHFQENAHTMTDKLIIR